MEIVFSEKEDIPEIVELLKRSLGEKRMPKTQAYYIWKHQKNPFGQSITLVAKESGKIVGVRTFMKWEWSFGEKKIASVRAVDTATDPLYQGKGIFRMLTLKAIDECKREGISFIYNTPNPISLKGYLKMGWNSIGKMPLNVRLGSIIPGFFDEIKNEKYYQEYDVENQLKKLPNSWSFKQPKSISTELTIPYLNWRYVECPVSSYGAFIEPGKFGIIFRLKKIKLFYEFRICESWLENSIYEEDADQKIRSVIKKIKPLIVTDSYFQKKNQLSNYIKLNFASPFIGPLTTVKNLTDINNKSEFIRFDIWFPSLGAMELF